MSSKHAGIRVGHQPRRRAARPSVSDCRFVRQAVVSSQPAETLLQVVQRGGLVERWRDCRIPWLSNCLATSG
jgi:hypothetical protein